MPRRRTLALLYTAYAISLVVKRSYAFWSPEVSTLLGGAGEGALGFAWEAANGVAKVFGAVVVDLVSPTRLLAASIGVQGATALALLVPFSMLSTGGVRPPWSRRACVASAVAAWGGNGLAQAFAWPALTRVFLAWVPDTAQRGAWYGVLATSQNAGAAVAPLLTAAAATTYGWPARIVLPGALALAFAVFLSLTLSDAPPAPEERGGRATKAVSVVGAPPTPECATPPPPSASALLASVVASRTLWALSANYFFNSLLRNGLTSGVKLLLEDALRLPQGAAAAANMAYECGGALGGLLAGLLSDRCCRSRRAPIMAAAGLLAAPLPLLLPLLGGTLASAGADGVIGQHSFFFVVALYFALGLCAFPPHVLNGLVSRELAPPGAQATAGGFTKAWGQAGSALADLCLIAAARRVGWSGVAAGLSLASVLSALTVLPLLRTVAPPPALKRA